MPASFAVGWRQVGACFISMGATGMIASTYSIVAVPLDAEFRPSRMMLMVSMTVLSAVCAFLAPLLGNLMDNVSLRKLMIAGGLFLGLGAALSLTSSFNQVLLIYGLLMAPASVLLGPLPATVLLTRWFTARRGRALGIAIAGIPAAGFIFPMIIQGLLDTYPWREAMQLLALILVIWTVSAALLVVDRPSDRGLNPDGAAEPPAPVGAETSQAPVSVGAVLSDPAFWMIVVIVAVVTSGMKGMITNLAPLAIDTGIKARDAAMLVSIYSACGLLAKAVFAALADRTSPRVLMFSTIGGFAIGMACLTQAGAGYGVIALGVGIIGLFGGLMVPIQSYLAPRVFGQSVIGRAMGLLTGVVLVATLSIPPLFGLIFDLTGSYTAIFWSFCGLALVTLMLVPAIRLHPQEKPSVAPVPAE